METSNPAHVPLSTAAGQNWPRQQQQQREVSGVDEFDNIVCPNTFEDDSKIDLYFDSHYSTPSPSLRRSKRIANIKLSDEIGSKSKVCAPGKSTETSTVSTLSKKQAPAKVTVDKHSSTGTLYSTSSANLRKVPSTLGPADNRSLLRVALGNVGRKYTNTTQKAQEPVVQRRIGPRTSTPKQKARLPLKHATKTTAVVKTNNARGRVIAEEAEPSSTQAVKNAPTSVRPVFHSEKPRILTETSRTRNTAGQTKPAGVSASNRQIRNALTNQKSRPLQTVNKHVVAKALPGEASRSTLNRTKTKISSSIRTNQKSVGLPHHLTKKTLNREVTPRKVRETRKSLKTIVKKRNSVVRSTKVVAATTLATGSSLKNTKQISKANNVGLVSGQGPRGNQNYKHVRSKVAQLINSTSAVPALPKFKHMKTAAETAIAGAKATRKPLHDKPFLPPGKVKHEETAFDVSRGNLTIGGQTMAQFIRNFHYQTPERYRTLKPGQNFQTTCENHAPNEPIPTIPKSPKFATNSRLRRTVLKPS